MHTAATGGTVRSDGSGRIAFEQRAAILPGVSAPSSVVRSIMRTARSRAKSFDSRLMDRRASESARSSTATWSTEPILGSRGSSGSSKPEGSAGALAIAIECSPGGLGKRGAVEEFRVEGWSELHERLFEDSWQPELGRHRSNRAFRGRTSAAEDLSTSLRRLGGDARSLEVYLLRNFRKYARRGDVPADSVWDWLAAARNPRSSTPAVRWGVRPLAGVRLAPRQL